MRKGRIVVLIKLLVMTLHLKIVNERTSVAFDDIICLLTPWNTRLSNQTNIMLHFQELLKRPLNLLQTKIRCVFHSNTEFSQNASFFLCSMHLWHKCLERKRELIYALLRKLVWRLFSKARMQFIKAFCFNDLCVRREF